jgi:hypothetical protein
MLHGVQYPQGRHRVHLTRLDYGNGSSRLCQLTTKGASVFIFGAMIIDDSIVVIYEIFRVTVDNGFTNITEIAVVLIPGLGNQLPHALEMFIRKNSIVLEFVETIVVQGVSRNGYTMGLAQGIRQAYG